MGAIPLVWGVTIALIVALLAFDYFFHVRQAHIPTLREAAIWFSIYVGVAIMFGITVWTFGGHQMGVEYFAGYVTEKALSVDNLFVFLIIMSSFKVPRADQQKVLLFGITFAIVARTGFIVIGAALLDNFAFLFYIFGLFLVVTAGRLLTPGDESDDPDNITVRLAKKVIPATDHYDGDKLFTVENGKKVMTPMLLVMVAIGGTDLLFALDSIPAIFGLTRNVFIVFTATVFSLLGLRQLYFLIDGLLDRLVYLSFGLAEGPDHRRRPPPQQPVLPRHQVLRRDRGARAALEPHRREREQTLVRRAQVLRRSGRTLGARAAPTAGLRPARALFAHLVGPAWLARKSGGDSLIDVRVPSNRISTRPRSN
ncbi:MULTISPECIES: TerC family protein [unclassified Dietzia]|uniref:TerC family protein n=1 Tax=unclassified Dietzia TaxID=2617939 RepID=UPI0015FBE116|nr:MULTISPECIES: TerC family protein [unclassified Dietzia]MBB1023254.1 TerC family protein [Dietzia sp. DQ12-76]MBB1028321.1 TerC family protein [Dietzia sp. DQ11-38-2]